MTELLIGIDLGATNVRAGAFTQQGELLDSEAVEIEARRGPQAGLERIGDLVAGVLRRVSASPAGIGVGSTGPTDTARGLIVNPGTLPGWVNVPIVDYLERRFDAPACLENDADAAALGEYWMGAAKGIGRLFAVLAGTGMGTACILDGEVYRGADGFHPEGGHMIVDPSGPECYCGMRGCWESWASGTAIAAAAREVLEIWTRHDLDTGEAAAGLPATGMPAALDTPLLQLANGDPQRITARLVAEAARRHDPVARSVIAAAAERFALGIYSLIMLYHPEMIVLGGGVMRSHDLFMPDIQRVVRIAGISVPLGALRVEQARLGDHAGMYGAAYAIRHKLAASS